MSKRQAFILDTRFRLDIASVPAYLPTFILTAYLATTDCEPGTISLCTMNKLTTVVLDHS